MKFSFKKITALASTALMAMGVVAAANYPAPFVSGSSADVAIVYGTGVGVDSSDFVQATSIQTDLSESYTGGASAVAGEGDKVKLERSSDKFNLGDSAKDVFVVSLTDENLPNLLADGTYLDDNNEEYDFTQKIVLGSNLNLTHFSDSDYKEDTPTIGIRLPGSTHVLNYTLDFTTNPDFTPDALETTTLTLMGKEYYILDVVNSSTSANSTTLLDSASSALITEGETKTVQGKSVYVRTISESKAYLTIDGEDIKGLEEGQTMKLSDGSYVGVKELIYLSKQGTVSSVEISLGSGKLKITDGSSIELNDDTIEEIKGYLSQSNGKLDKITLEWTTDDEAFVTPDSELLMPGFEAVKLSMGGMNFPAEEETIIKNDGSDRIKLEAPIKDGVANIYLLYANSTGEFVGIGKDSNNKLVTSSGSQLTFNETNNDRWFVASWNATSEGESYLLSASVSQHEDDNRTTIKNEVTGDDVCEHLNEGDTCSIGSLILTVDSIYDVGSNEWVTFNISSGGSFNTLYTKEGLKIYLPHTVVNSTGLKGEINVSDAGVWQNTAGHGYDSFYLYMAEEDRNENLAKGKTFNVTLGESGTSDKVHVSDVDTGSSEYEIDDTDDYESYVVSDLATKVVYDTGGDQDWATITYHGEESYADVYVTAPSVTLTKGDGLGNIVVKDSEVSSVSDKNLIVVGGSCINSVAATILGGSYCGAEFTSATGVGTGQFLIQSVESPYDSSKTALLVAGYEAADTVAAATYLTTQTVDTSVGKKYIGTGATSAELVVE